MGQIQIYNDSILIVDGKIAVHPDCCCGTENTCNDCDPPIPDTLYVTFPTGLSGDFAPYAGNTYEVNWVSGCRWFDNDVEVSGDTVDVSWDFWTPSQWNVFLGVYNNCYVLWTSNGECNPEGTYGREYCEDGGCYDGSSCEDSTGDATVSE